VTPTNHQLAGALVLLTVSLSVAAEDDKRGELDELRTRIRAAATEKKRLQEDAGKVMSELKQQEMALADASERLAQINEAVEQKQANLTVLVAHRQQLDATLHAERQLLARALRSHYASDPHDTLKLVLNQEDPQQLSRLLMYHALLTRSTLKQIASATAALHHTDAIAETTRLETEKLQYLQAEQTKAIASVDQLRVDRKKTLLALKSEIASQEERLRALRTDKRALEKLLQSLHGPPGAAVIPVTGTGLGKLKGQLPWPTPGRIARKFGENTSKDSELTTRGVFIEAKAGSVVRAVADGRVAFADWFQSFGLLLIVDHGEGYLSLYGHNQSLSKKVGEVVRGGELIAAVGDSGGQNLSGLYFEIRYRGTAEDPAQWCR